MSLEKVAGCQSGFGIIVDESGHFRLCLMNSRVGGGGSDVCGKRSVVGPSWSRAIGVTKTSVVLIRPTHLALFPSLHLRIITLDPGYESDLKHGVYVGVHLIQNIRKLEDKLVILDIQGLVGLGVGEGYRETHWPKRCQLMRAIDTRYTATHPISWY